MENKINTQQSFVGKNKIIIEVIVLVLFLGLIYYAYTTFSNQEVIISKSAVNEQLLGQNFSTFLKVVNQEGLSFKDISVLASDLVSNMEDFSETIGETTSRGRDNPFTPYATPRSTR